jgi:hypothetical protein
MASEKDIELLDDYLANRMSAEDRSVFEKNLNTNKDLQSELSLQQGVVEGLRKARASELKNMLRNVPVSNLPTQGTTLATKAIIGISATAILGALVYFTVTYTKQSADAATKTEPISNSKNQLESTKQPNTKDTPVEPIEQISANPVVKKSKAEKSISPQAIEEPIIEVFDPASESEENSSEPEEDEDVAFNESSTPATVASISVSVEPQHRKHDFHYTFVADQITLFGSFEKNLYEILEFITDKKRVAFLYYKQTYYSITPTEKATRLAPIQDPVLIKKLNDHRSQK